MIKPQYLNLLSLLFIWLSFSTLSFSQEACLKFNGEFSRVTIPAQVSASLGANDFTFEAFINGLESENGTGTILSNRTSSNEGFHFFVHTYWSTSEHKMLSFRYNGINWLFINNGEYDDKILDGDCHHVAVTKSNGTLSFYIDGNLIGTHGSGNMPDLNLDTGAPIVVGNDITSNDAFDGTINDVRIWNIARSESEIRDGIENGVNPNENGLLGYWGMREGSGQTITDLTNQNDAILGNDETVNLADAEWGSNCCDFSPPASGTCLNFNGEDDFASIPAEVGESLGANDFTIEANINGLESENGTATILSNRIGANNGLHFFVHTYWSTSEHKMLSLRYNGINWLFINNGEFDGKILDGTCHHVAVTKSNGTLSFYIDGNLIGTKGGGNLPDLDLNSGARLIIGNDLTSNDAFNGTINDVRIWNIARSESEIQDGIENGVNPNENGLLGNWGMWEGSGQTIEDLTGQNDATLGNSEFEEGSDPEWGAVCCVPPPVEDGKCLSFDGESTYVTIPADVGQSLAANDFTLEAHITGLEDANGTGSILSNRTSTNSGFQFFIHPTWGGSQHKMLSLRYNSINWLLIDNGDFDAALLDGDCHHVAVTQSNGLISFYVDGSLIGTKGGGTTPNLNMDTGAPILIGNDGHSNDAFNGTIDNVRIWNVVRTESEILEGIENGVDPNEDGLLGYWGMTEGSGQVISDYTNKNDAVLGNQSEEDDNDPAWGELCCGPDVALNIEELENEFYNINIYPNPNDGIFTLDLGPSFLGNKYQYTVHDNIGRVILKNKLTSSTINLGQLISGQYWLRIFNDKEVLGITKFSLIK